MAAAGSPVGTDRSEHGPACAQGPAPPSRGTAALSKSRRLRRRDIFGASSGLLRVAAAFRPREAACESSGCGRSAAGLVTLVVARTQLCAKKHFSFAELLREQNRFQNLGSFVKDVQALRATAAPVIGARAAERQGCPGAGWHCCASGGAPLAPAGRDRCSGTPRRHGSRRSRSHSDRAASRWEVPIVLHHGAPAEAPPEENETPTLLESSAAAAPCPASSRSTRRKRRNAGQAPARGSRGDESSRGIAIYLRVGVCDYREMLRGREFEADKGSTANSGRPQVLGRR